MYLPYTIPNPSGHLFSFIANYWQLDILSTYPSANNFSQFHLCLYVKMRQVPGRKWTEEFSQNWANRSWAKQQVMNGLRKSLNMKWQSVDIKWEEIQRNFEDNQRKWNVFTLAKLVLSLTSGDGWFEELRRNEKYRIYEVFCRRKTSFEISS